MCGRYTNQRNDLLHDLNFIQNINLKLLLFGGVSRSIEDNTRIFEAVQNFIGKKQKDFGVAAERRLSIANIREMCC